MPKLTPIAIATVVGAISVASADTPAEPSWRSAASESAKPFLTNPPRGEGPVTVQAGFHLRGINEIDDEAETFEFGCVLVLTWKDERQAFDPADAGAEEKVYLGAYQFNEVFDGWFPQVVLVNESGLYDKQGTVLRVQTDGTITLIETVNAVAEADLQLRRYPFDRQRLTAVFEVLGSSASEVVLQADASARGASSESVQTPQWTLTRLSASTTERITPTVGGNGIASAYVVTMDVERESFFMLRLVVLPLILIVVLSWSVFWMDRSSLGDRINVSFIGILTAVAYQIVVSDISPHIAYMTLMHGFLNLSLIIMCATVVINLIVGKLDQAGKIKAGDRLDRRCRWIFPLTYVGLNLVMVGIAFLVF